jgi:hypothetical protein
VKSEALDLFLSEALRCTLGRAAPPAWPSAWPDDQSFHDALVARISFHGIALALLRKPALVADWPQPVRDAVRAEACSQSFWELGHREVTTRLIDALAEAGIEGIFAKGTALAYSFYPDPAMRRRGDSDILIAEAVRNQAVMALRARGFRRLDDVQPLQESWAADCRMGNTHAFDLHWRVKSSPVLAQALERAGIGTRTMPLPRLDGRALALAPADNLLMVAVNRSSHDTFGYYVDNLKMFDQDRLIWALDVDLICAAFTESVWQNLLETARASGTGPLIHSTLAFAAERLGTVVPADISQALAAEPGDATLMRYLGDMPGLARLRLNLAACQTLGAKVKMIRYTLFPRSQNMRARFPDTAHWPLPALYARRLWSGLRPGQRQGA